MKLLLPLMKRNGLQSYEQVNEIFIKSLLFALIIRLRFVVLAETNAADVMQATWFGLCMSTRHLPPAW